MKLQVLSSRDNSIPFRVALSKPFADLAGEIRSWQTDLSLSHVEKVFSSFQASLLQRYGSYYCCAEYLSSKGHYASRGQTTFMPLEAVALLFFNQPPQPDVLQSISYVLRLAMQLAESNGMLVSPSDAQGTAAGYRHQVAQKGIPVLADLVPRRTENNDLMTTSNPLTSRVVIADKLARRLYREIDGQKNVQELCDATRLDIQAALQGLRILINERHIELLDASGKLVDSSFLLDNL
jgi:hypothetical protein